MSSSSSNADLRHPRYWPAWAGIGVLRLLGYLPFPLLWALGMGLGRLVGRLARHRRCIVLRNLEICFPQATPRERARIAGQHFGYLGVAALTQGLVWGASRRRLRRIVRIRHGERFTDLRAQGCNMIVLMPHFVGLELGGAAFTALVHPGMYMYQRVRNPVLDAQMQRSRQRFGALAVERQDDLRSLIRKIRQGIPFFYLPDQNAGRGDGIFVPFCGLPASTFPMLGRFARLGRAVVLPACARYRPWGLGLDLIFDPPWTQFPSGDPVADTAYMNQQIEARMRTMPAQYFWVHRRFKTRPLGEPPRYPPKRSKTC